MRRFVVGFFAVIGLLAFLVIVAIVGGIYALTRGAGPTATASVPDTAVLTLDLTQGLTDGPPQDPLLRLVVGAKPTMREVLDGIERASGDPHVKGLYARLGTDDLGLPLVQELRDAVRDFRAKGKFAIAFADSFGEFGPGTRPYYLAAGFDQIWLQPMGTVGLTGLYAEVPFVKGTLDLIGITASFGRREQYKTAMNSLTETKMTPPHREETDQLIASMAGQVVAGIAEGRKLSPDAVRGLVDRGPFFADEAAKALLVDKLGYADEALANARQRAGSGAQTISLDDYLSAAGHPHASGTRIALIYGNGLIQSQGGTPNPLTGTAEISARDMIRAFRDASRDSDVRAILFRIDSPGGSVVASETIWRAVAQAKAAGKPVIVSMGDLAGSGGYYIAAPADKIVAEPATLTGSIGVLAGKLVLSGLMEKLGVSVDTSQFGADAAMFSADSEFSPQAHQRLETFLDLTYQGFKDRVAQGRHMTPEAVEAVAKGRVWTGEDAKARGLVDELGGYAVALRLAREAAHLGPDAPVDLVAYPREKGPGQILMDRLMNRRDGSDTARSGALARGIATLDPVLQGLARLFAEAPGAAMMPLTGAVK